MKFLVRTLFVAFLFTTMMWAQATSQITGTVHDPSGGAVPGAVVKITQTDTGFTRSMETSAQVSQAIRYREWSSITVNG